MKTLRMTLMVSFTFAALVSLAAPQPDSQMFQLKYLSGVTHGKVVHVIPVKAHDFNEAIVKAGKQCVHDLLDLNVAHDDIVDMCNNPRL